MNVPAAEQTTYYLDGEPIEIWSPTLPEFSCKPDELRRYIDRGRWDLVFNGLCYLAGAIEEGTA
jgi:hypothetical protein